MRERLDSVLYARLFPGTASPQGALSGRSLHKGIPWRSRSGRCLCCGGPCDHSLACAASRRSRARSSRGRSMRGSVPTITQIVCWITIWWGRSDRSPATMALLDIRVVALRVVTIIPIGRWRRGRPRRRRFDIDRRGRDHHRGVVIGSPVRSPIRSPVQTPP